MYNKRGHVNLETSASFHNRLDTNLAFFSTDLGTADLVFNITRNKSPLLVSEENASTLLILMKGDEYIVQEVEYVDPMNGQLKVTVDDKVLARPGKWRGQIYIEVHDVNNPSKEDIVTQAEFTFDIKDSVINTIPAIDKLNEIRTFIDFREEIMETISEINTALENGEDYVSQMEATKASGMKALNDRSTQVVNEIKALVDNHKQELNDLKDNNITELDNKANQIKEDIEELNNYDTSNWQKYRLTNDDGTRHYISKTDMEGINVNDFDTGLYEIVATDDSESNGLPKGFGAFIMQLDVTTSNNGRKQFLLNISSQNRRFVKSIHNNNESEWKELTNDNTRQWLGTLGEETSGYNSVLELPPGLYECSIPSDAFKVDAPLDPNGSGYIAEIDVYEGRDKRKQFRLIANARNDEYRATIHTSNTQFPNGQFTGWKKVQNEEEFDALFNDTGWKDWDTLNGATKRNTTDTNQVQCQYRVRMVNGVKIAHLRVNVNNLTTQQAFGSIPAELVPVEQQFVPRMPVSLHPGAMLVSTEGNLIFYSNTQDSSWLPGHYIVGEFSWIIDDVQ